MRVQVEHDARGAIKTVAVLYEESGQASHVALKAREGYKVAHVEVRDLSSESDLEKIREIKSNFRVENSEGIHRLVRK